MRTLLITAFFALLTACGRGETIIEGTLLDAGDAASVWVSGASERAAVDGVAFRLQGVAGDTIDLLFGDDEDSAARMRLIGLPAGSQLTLHGVWVENGLAFPTTVDLAGGRTVAINGLRMGGGEALGGEVDTRGTLLAMSGDEERLMIRPDDESMPDLRVVVRPGAAVVSVDGDPTDIDRLEAGDTVEVRGSVENGYVLATQLVVPRRVASGVSGPELLGVPVEREPVRPEDVRRDDDDRDEDQDEAERGRGNEPDGRPGRGRFGRPRN